MSKCLINANHMAKFLHLVTFFLHPKHPHLFWQRISPEKAEKRETVEHCGWWDKVRVLLCAGEMSELIVKFVGENSEAKEENYDAKLPLCFCKKRHTQPIRGIECIAQCWRMKERVSLLIRNFLLGMSLVKSCIVWEVDREGL